MEEGWRAAEDVGRGEGETVTDETGVVDNVVVG